MKALIAGIVLAHSFYSAACCGGKDCQPVPCSEIHPTADGWTWNGIPFPRHVLHPSEDGGCHICVHKEVLPSGICIYLRPET
jgi:hypothetical protein